MKWLTTRQVAEDCVQRDVSTVTRDAQQGLLHGHQKYGPDGKPVPRSRWSFHPAAVDTYMRGGDLRAQKQACGCAHLALVRRAG